MMVSSPTLRFKFCITLNHVECCVLQNSRHLRWRSAPVCKPQLPSFPPILCCCRFLPVGIRENALVKRNTEGDARKNQKHD